MKKNKPTQTIRRPEDSVFLCIKQLIIKNPFQLSAVVFVCLIAYGFFATKYTYHIDSLESSYYDGVTLISAGRFVAPFIHRITNWMAFSPFWQTVMFCGILVIAGLFYAVLLKRESGNRISDKELFFFVMLFVSSPLMVGQLTFPNLNIALSFVLVPWAIWMMDPSNKPSIKRFIAGVLLMVPAIDMYESFAPVFFVCCFFVLLLRYYFDRDSDLNGKKYLLVFVQRVLYFVAVITFAIIIDYGLSKIICKIFTGSFDYWYSGNTVTYWFNTSSSLHTSLKKLFSLLIIDLFLTPAEHFWAFLFDASFVFLGVTTLAVSIKKVKKSGILKCLIGISCFVLMFAFSKALDIIMFKTAPLRTMQPVLLFISFAGLIFAYSVGRIKSKQIKSIGVFVCLLILLLQTQTLNNFAVRNQERFNYEDHILTAVCDDLCKMDIQNKNVCFYSPKDYCLPKAFQFTPSANPIAKRFRAAVFSVWNKLMPASFIDFLNRYFESEGPFHSAEDCLRLRITYTEAEVSYLHAIAAWKGQYDLPKNTFERKGLILNIVPQDEEKLDAYYEQTVFGKGEKYRIIEEGDLITVIFIKPDY